MKPHSHIITFIITVFTILVCTSTSHANDQCALVKNEIIFGEALLKKSYDRNKLLKAITEFKAATIRAPRCAKAFYNLGVSYDKTKQYGLALNALKTYLRLAPNAKNFTEVESKTFKLEYLARKKREQERIRKRNAKYASVNWDAFQGTWCVKDTCNSTDNSIAHKEWLRFPDRATYNVNIRGKVFEAYLEYNNYLEGAGTFIHRKYFKGFINKEGMIKGHYTDGNIQPSGKCAGKFFNYNTPFTGTLVQNGPMQTITLKWKWWLGLRHNMTECILYKGTTGRWIDSIITLIRTP